jgi:hypothetical protein
MTTLDAWYWPSKRTSEGEFPITLFEVEVTKFKAVSNGKVGAFAGGVASTSTITGFSA